MKNLIEIERYAKDNYVPIIRKDNIEYLEKLIKDKKISSKIILDYYKI